VVKRGVLILLGLYIGAVLFMPKKFLFYKVEEIVPSLKIEGNLTSTPISLRLTDGVISYQGIKMGKVGEVVLYPLLLVNYLRGDFTLSTPAVELKGVKLFYTPFLPFTLWIWGENFRGKVNLKGRRVDIAFSSPPPSLRGFLKKRGKEYEFNTTF